MILNIINYIFWNQNPEIFHFGTFAVRWYGLLFAMAFMAGQSIITKIFISEGHTQKDVDRLSLYMILAVVLGARLGHCLFYEPEYYLKHPIDILKIWEGGLASHGATIGILLSVYLYSRTAVNQSYLYLLDRLSIIVALGGSFIRIGNLMNSEIIGKPWESNWAFIFVQVDNLPRHPAQLYEAITTFILFLILGAIYLKYKKKTPEGLLVGIFFTCLFIMRFFYEYIKENQVEFEQKMPINMGQILSIPMIIFGILMIIISLKNKQKQTH